MWEDVRYVYVCYCRAAWKFNSSEGSVKDSNNQALPTGMETIALSHVMLNRSYGEQND